MHNTNPQSRNYPLCTGGVFVFVRGGSSDRRHRRSSLVRSFVRSESEILLSALPRAAVAAVSAAAAAAAKSSPDCAKCDAWGALLFPDMALP